jgi:hypothetical protein
MDEKVRKLLTTQSEKDPRIILKYCQELAGPVDYSDPWKVDAWLVEVERKLGEPLHPTVVEKLRAYFQVLTNPKVFQEWQIFEPVANCLIDGICNTEYMSPPSELELLFMGYVMTRDRIEFPISDEVKTYVRTLWTKQYGYSKPHPWLVYFFEPEDLDDEYHQLIGYLFEYVRALSENPDLELPTDPLRVQAYRMAIPTILVQLATQQ